MSFGWSAGDIATVVAVTYNLIQALDDTHGSAKDYREAVGFLTDLKRVLESLQTFTAWNAYPAYGREIRQQIDQIKQPVGEFLAAVMKYEPSLGEVAENARKRWRNCMPRVLRKIQWYIFMSEKVLGLKKKIELHMRILDSLMQRLTLDVVWTAQQELPNTLRNTFQETIQPELIAVLRECLPPRAIADQNTRQDAAITSLSEHYQLISSNMEEIKQQIRRPEITQRRLEASILGENNIGDQRTLPLSQDTTNFVDDPLTERFDQATSQKTGDSAPGTAEDSLSEVYYLVLLYLGHFLKNIFLALSRMVQPSRALMPTLLAKYNISFLDAIGRPRRVLPFEYFRSFKILQAFIEHEYRDLPGSSWVKRGRYLLLSLGNNQALNETNWNRSIAPGSTIAMSMLVRKPLAWPLNPDEEQCPEPSYSGTWRRSKMQPWTTCPVCQKEVYTSILETSNTAEDVSKSSSSSSRPPQRRVITSSSFNGPQVDSESETETEDEDEDEDEDDDDDISIFKRIAQEVLRLGWTPFKLGKRIYREPGDNRVYELLDPRYRQVRDKEKRSFWRIGRVFMMLWTEPSRVPAEGRSPNGSYLSMMRLNTGVYTELRRFVVIHARYASSLCLPIQTYSGLATLSSNLSNPQQHAIIYTSKHAPEERWCYLHDGSVMTESLTKEPIKVNAEQEGPEAILDHSSRINYGKIHTVEHDVRVLNIGQVDKHSIDSLRRNSMIYCDTPDKRPQKLRRRRWDPRLLRS